MRSLVCVGSGLCSEMCRGASYREKHLTLAKHGKMNVLKINDDDDEQHDSIFIKILYCVLW